MSDQETTEFLCPILSYVRNGICKTESCTPCLYHQYGEEQCKQRCGVRYDEYYEDISCYQLCNGQNNVGDVDVIGGRMNIRSLWVFVADPIARVMMKQYAQLQRGTSKILVHIGLMRQGGSRRTRRFCSDLRRYHGYSVRTLRDLVLHSVDTASKEEWRQIGQGRISRQ